jgi:hypothetical protein
MAQFDALLIDGGFAVGSTPYVDHYPGDQRNTRIVVTVASPRGHAVPMIVDTGAPWCILDPELAELWGLTPTATYTPSTALNVRGTSYRGSLLRASIILLATRGADLEVEATFFMPILGPGEEWPWPNFLGLDGCLNRIRFAVDTTENVFYFGAR